MQRKLGVNVAERQLKIGYEHQDVGTAEETMKGSLNYQDILLRL
jgi:hypothetical protein